MNFITSQSRLAQISHSHFIVVGIGFGLGFLHLLLVIQVIGNFDQCFFSLLCWIACIFLLWRKRKILIAQRDPVPSIIGTVLLFLLLYKALNLLSSDSAFIRIFPGISMLALALTTSGWRIRQYWREAIIILILILPKEALESLIEWLLGDQIKTFIAYNVAIVMHYGGSSLIVKGNQIYLNSGVVSIEYACTGIPILIILLQLTTLVLIIFKFNLDEALKIVLGVVLISLVLAVVRVVIMAHLIQQPEAFNYWHGAAGGQIFSTIGLVCFALLCRYFLEEES